MDNISKKQNRADDWYNCECPICNKKFHLKPYRLKRAKNHYCSIDCHKEAKKMYMSGELNHQYGLKGNANASWKSDVRKTRLGYIRVRQLDHPFADRAGFVLEHRLVAERFLLTDDNSIEINGKRYLKPEYEVHHKNFDRQNNSVSNLTVLTRQEHKKIHNKLNPNKIDELGRFTKKEPSLIKIKRVSETAIIPERKSIGAAGYDLCPDIKENVEIPPHETVMLQTNLAFEIPKNYFGAIYARSGLATKAGLRPSTCVSVIDSDYRGSVGVPVYNDSSETRIIRPGDRIAQIIFQKALIVELEIVDKLAETDRGDNGFGSTGK